MEKNRKTEKKKKNRKKQKKVEKNGEKMEKNRKKNELAKNRLPSNDKTKTKPTNRMQTIVNERKYDVFLHSLFPSRFLKRKIQQQKRLNVIQQVESLLSNVFVLTCIDNFANDKECTVTFDNNHSHVNVDEYIAALQQLGLNFEVSVGCCHLYIYM